MHYTSDVLRALAKFMPPPICIAQGGFDVGIASKWVFSDHSRHITQLPKIVTLTRRNTAGRLLSSINHGDHESIQKLRSNLLIHSHTFPVIILLIVLLELCMWMNIFCLSTFKLVLDPKLFFFLHGINRLLDSARLCSFPFKSQRTCTQLQLWSVRLCPIPSSPKTILTTQSSTVTRGQNPACGNTAQMCVVLSAWRRRAAHWMQPVYLSRGQSRHSKTAPHPGQEGTLRI